MIVGAVVGAVVGGWVKSLVLARLFVVSVPLEDGGRRSIPVALWSLVEFTRSSRGKESSNRQNDKLNQHEKDEYVREESSSSDCSNRFRNSNFVDFRFSSLL